LDKKQAQSVVSILMYTKRPGFTFAKHPPSQS